MFSPMQLFIRHSIFLIASIQLLANGFHFCHGLPGNAPSRVRHLPQSFGGHLSPSAGDDDYQPLLEPGSDDEDDPPPSDDDIDPTVPNLRRFVLPEIIEYFFSTDSTKISAKELKQNSVQVTEKLGRLMLSDYDEQKEGAIRKIWEMARVVELDRVIFNYYLCYVQHEEFYLESKRVKWIKYDSSEEPAWSRLPLSLIYQNKCDMALVVWKRITQRHKYNPTIAKNGGLADQTLQVMMLEMAIAAIYANNVTIYDDMYQRFSEVTRQALELAHFFLAVLLEKEDVADSINGKLDCRKVLLSYLFVCKHLKTWYTDYSGLATSYDSKTLKPVEPKNEKYITKDGKEWNPRNELAIFKCWQVGPICNLNPDDSIDIEELKWTGIDNKPFSEEFYQPEAEK